MKLGKLNELLDNIGLNIAYADSALVPAIEENGNPLKGEHFLIKWQSIYDKAVALHITLPQVCFVDRVCLQLGEKVALQAASLLRGREVLYRYSAQTGKAITQEELQLEAGELLDSFTVVLESDFANIDLTALDIYGALEDGVDLFPTPNAVTLGEGLLPASHFTAYCGDCDEGLQAGKLLAEKFFEKTGVALTAADTGEISFIKDASVAVDGYELSVTEEQTLIRASNLRGFVCGAETFIKLLADGAVHTATISDAPAMPFRGVHLFIPSEANMDFAKQLIKYVISPMGYNTVIMQVSGGLQYHSHPKIWQAFEATAKLGREGKCPYFPHIGIADGKPITRELLKEYLDYIRSFGIEIIPEVQSLAHVQYMTHAYPEIAEIAVREVDESVDTREEDAMPSKFFHHNYCPSNPRSYEILFDILDEIIEVFQPKEYVHMGHDEAIDLGICPLCKDKNHAQMFADDVNKIYAHLAEKGLKMMMWGDMLQPVTKYQTSPAIDMIPKDIVLLDFIWYFHLDKDIEENLLDKGFQVIFGNVYSSHFPRYESRIRKEGILGGQISAWTCTSERVMQQEGKLYDFLMTAQMFWSKDYRKKFFLCYDRMVSQRIKTLREDLRGIKTPSALPGAKTELLIENPIAFPPQLPAAQQTEFAVNGSYDSLVFYHTQLRKVTREPWTKLEVAGRYVITYTDGTTEDVEITTCGNIGYWNRRQNQPVPHRAYRHTGYIASYYSDGIFSRTTAGEPVTVYRYEHILQQNKSIASVALVEDPAYDTKIFLCKAEGIRN